VELVVDDRFLDIEKGEADIAIRGTTALADSRLLSRRMSDIDWGLYCSRDYALRHGVPATPADLADHALIGGEGSLLNMPPMQWMFAQAPGAEVHCRSNSLTNLAFAVKAGLGLAPLPFLLADAEPDLVRCLGPIRDFPSAVFVLTRPQSRDLPRIRAFVDFIVPHFQAVARGLLQRGEANQAAAAAFLAEAATARAGRSSA
jgi:DNA-binding transcriptional LysR family regulator